MLILLGFNGDTTIVLHIFTYETGSLYCPLMVFITIVQTAT